MSDYSVAELLVVEQLLKPEIWLFCKKFIPVKITNHMVSAS